MLVQFFSWVASETYYSSLLGKLINLAKLQMLVKYVNNNINLLFIADFKLDMIDPQKNKGVLLNNKIHFNKINFKSINLPKKFFNFLKYEKHNFRYRDTNI